MPETVIAVNLFTVRQFVKTPQDIASTLKKVRTIGYQAVQCSAHGVIEPKELRRIADNEGVRICATHTDYCRLRDETQSVIEEHRILGCNHPAVAGLPQEYRENAEGYQRFAAEAEQIGRKLSEAGMTFSYHNHSFEFEMMGGRSGMSILFETTAPAHLKSELDTYWVQYAGADPSAWIERLSDRIVLLHVKDMAVRGFDQLFAEVGKGNLNWPAILAAARQAGVEWYIVEQDKCERDPFDSLKISLENLKSMGLS